MSRQRRHQESGEFGSDSFLDIVANIVGILIILIVIAGVRMSQAPLPEGDSTEMVGESTPATPETRAESQPQPDEERAWELRRQQEFETQRLAAEAAARRLQAEWAAEAEAERQRLARLEYDREPTIEFDLELGQPSQFAPRIDPALQQEVQTLQEKIGKSREARRQLEDELSRLQAMIARQTEQLQEFQQRAEADKTALADEQQRQSRQTAELARLMRHKANLDEQLVLVQRAKQSSDSLKHTMTPVSRQVAGHEWHFELRGGKVSFIPLDELMGQLKQKVERWAEWIARYERHEGIVGPVEGYSLEYKVSRQRGSLVDELSGGRGTFSIMVDGWELNSTNRSFAETLEQARQPNSQFYSTLNRCSLDDTITFWVYPDSFEMYRELARVAHSLGYQVAGRPLRADKRIGGSPQGSKSFSQ